MKKFFNLKNLFKPHDREDMKCGGWSDVKNGEISNELEEIFSKAVKDTQYCNLKPTRLLQTQVVAGINYLFIGKENEKEYYVKIYRDLSENCSIMSVKNK